MSMIKGSKEKKIADALYLILVWWFLFLAQQALTSVITFFFPSAFSVPLWFLLTTSSGLAIYSFLMTGTGIMKTKA